MITTYRRYGIISALALAILAAHPSYAARIENLRQAEAEAHEAETPESAEGAEKPEPAASTESSEKTHPKPQAEKPRKESGKETHKKISGKPAASQSRTSRHEAEPKQAEAHEGAPHHAAPATKGPDAAPTAAAVSADMARAQAASPLAASEPAKPAAAPSPKDGKGFFSSLKSLFSGSSDKKGAGAPAAPQTPSRALPAPVAPATPKPVVEPPKPAESRGPAVPFRNGVQATSVSSESPARGGTVDVYMTLTNVGTVDETLTDAEAPVDKLTLVTVTDGRETESPFRVDIPAGKSVSLSSRGTFLRIANTAKPLKNGDRITMDFHYRHSPNGRAIVIVGERTPAEAR